MFYYLDKDEILKTRLPRLFHSSERPLNEKEIEILIERCKIAFNLSELNLIEFEYDFIPNYIDIDENGKVYEFIPIETFEETASETSETDNSSVEIFGEEDNNKYVYIQKEDCIKYHEPNISRVSKGKRLLNYKEYYNNELLEYIGYDMADIPNEIIYEPETDLVRGMTEYEKVKYKKRELNDNEVIIEKTKEIKTIEEGQYVDENEDIITVPRLEGENILIQEWDKSNHVWVNKTTDLDIVQAQYRDYKEMDTPSTVEEMRLQDEALATEYLGMMIELRSIMYSLTNESRTYKMVLPVPSKKLQEFKNKFEKFR